MPQNSKVIKNTVTSRDVIRTVEEKLSLVCAIWETTWERKSLNQVLRKSDC